MLDKKIFIYQKIFFIIKNEIKKSIRIITKNIRTIQNISRKKIKKKRRKDPTREGAGRIFIIFTSKRRCMG